MALTSRDQYEQEAKSLKASAGQREDETKALKMTADDLSRQVQSLLRQIAIQQNPLLANESMNGSSTVTESDVVSDHLVEFKSLRSLQEQNQKLLKVTRSLMAKLDAQEIRRATNEADDIDTGASLDQASETIEKLHSQLLELQKKISEVTRERDSFFKLLSRGEGLRRPTQVGNGPMGESAAESHQQIVIALQEEMSAIRTKAEQEMMEAKAALRAKSDEAGQSEVAKARAEAQINLLQGRSSRLSVVCLIWIDVCRTIPNDERNFRLAKARA